MAYNYFPQGYQPFYPQNNPQNNGIQWVQGIEGAKAHPVNAGQSVLLMDSDANCMYIKTADQMGMPTLRIFDYKERVQKPQNEPTSGFLTKEDLSIYVTKEDLEKAIEGLKEGNNE